jgi:nucleoside 2-deoxyribosyltransferase
MKYFGSRPDDPVVVCFEAIREADVLVGIYAMRYGWIPEGKNCSITEMEFDYARQLGKPCLCYVVDEKNANWPIHLIEFAAIAQLTAFKQKVGQLVRTTFTTPDNLAKNIVADLARLMKVNAGAGSDSKAQVHKKTGKSIPPHRAFYCNRSRQ